MKLGVAARGKAEVKDICSFTRIYIYIYICMLFHFEWVIDEPLEEPNPFTHPFLCH